MHSGRKREKIWKHFPSKVSIFWNNTATFGCSPLSPARPSDNSIIYMKMSMKHCWNDSDRRKPNLLGENSVPLSLCPPQIPNKLSGIESRPSAARGRSLSALSNGAVQQRWIFFVCVPFHTARLTLLYPTRRPLYLKSQCVPRCKHFSSRL
jgi:hypothetical protein